MPLFSPPGGRGDETARSKISKFLPFLPQPQGLLPRELTGSPDRQSATPLAGARALASELVLVLRKDVAASLGNQLGNSLVRGDTRSIEPTPLLVLVVHRSSTARATLRDEKRD